VVWIDGNRYHIADFPMSGGRNEPPGFSPVFAAKYSSQTSRHQYLRSRGGQGHGTNGLPLHALQFLPGSAAVCALVNAASAIADAPHPGVKDVGIQWVNCQTIHGPIGRGMQANQTAPEFPSVRGEVDLPCTGTQIH